MGEDFHMTQVILDKIQKVYSGDVAAVDDFSLEIPTGKLVAFPGSVRLWQDDHIEDDRWIDTAYYRRILFDGEDVLPIPAEKRGAVMVFQNYLLFPYMSVGDNVGFGLKMRGVKKRVISEKVAECWLWSNCRISPDDVRRSSPAGSSSGWRWRGR